MPVEAGGLGVESLIHLRKAFMHFVTQRAKLALQAFFQIDQQLFNIVHDAFIIGRRLGVWTMSRRLLRM